jgi:citrate lyase subunit beta/citryl-CoA lyase
MAFRRKTRPGRLAALDALLLRLEADLLAAPGQAPVVDLGIDGEGEELLYFRSRLVLESRLAGIQPPVDGVCTEIDDPEMLQADTLRARRQGFGGKLCIHPRQVPLVNAAFSPSTEDVAWAERVLAFAERAGGAAVAVDGRMVDRPVILKAERIVREAARRR